MSENQVINAIDEIPVGNPKYYITDNEDGTKNIELANELATQGTSLSKGLLDKVDNVLSYLTPTTTKVGNENRYNLDNNGNTFVNNQRIMTQMQGGIIEKTSEKNIIATGDLFDTQLLLLNNNNIFMVYHITGMLGRFIIFDKQGNIVKNETSLIDGIQVDDFSCCKLANGNIALVMCGYNDNKLYYMVLDENGNVVVTPKEINTTGTSYSYGRTRIIVMGNGNLFITYVYNSITYFEIIDASGTKVKNGTKINTGNASIPILLDNGNVIVFDLYRSSSTSYVEYTIYSNTGNVVTSRTKCDSSSNNHYLVNAYKESNGNIILIFGFGANVTSSSQALKYQIYNSSGTKIIDTQALFSTILYNAFEGVEITQINNTIAMFYPTNSFNKMAYKLYDLNMNEVGAEEEISSQYCYKAILVNTFDKIILFQKTNQNYGDITTHFFEINNNYLDMSGVTNNSLNGISIDTLLQPSKYYELVYNQRNNKFIANEVIN